MSTSIRMKRSNTSTPIVTMTDITTIITTRCHEANTRTVTATNRSRTCTLTGPTCTIGTGTNSTQTHPPAEPGPGTVGDGFSRLRHSAPDRRAVLKEPDAIPTRQRRLGGVERIVVRLRVQVFCWIRPLHLPREHGGLVWTEHRMTARAAKLNVRIGTPSHRHDRNQSPRHAPC